MKDLQYLVIVGLLLSLAVPAASQTYDNSPSQNIIIPECIWALATGGGDWVSELQITDVTGGSVVSAYYYFGTSYTTVTLWTSPGANSSVKFANILSTMQSLGGYQYYYGTVGTLWLATQDVSHQIQAQVRTVNGNYGKTFPGLDWTSSNTANVGRDMMIMDLTQNATYRTFAGCYNAISGGYPMTVDFKILDADGNLVGSSFSKTIGEWQFLSFNPFVEAGVGSGTYDDCCLWIHPTSAGDPGMGLFCFGSSANNNTNDTSAHIAVQAQ